jgi:hypothetical protein
MAISVGGDRAPVVEVITKLAVTTGKKVWLQMNAGNAVVTTCTPIATFLGLRDTGGPFRNVVDNADASGDP